MIWEGAPELEALLVPIDSLVTMPGNPRRGSVEAVAKSYTAFGQRKPVAVRTEGDDTYVVAGNHQLRAARDLLGWTHLAITTTDDLTKAESRAFALADNRTSDLAKDDDALLRAMLVEVAAEDPALIAAASWDDSDHARQILSAMETEARNDRPRPSAIDDMFDTSDVPRGEDARMPADYGTGDGVSLKRIAFGKVNMRVTPAEIAPVERAFKEYVDLHGTDAGFLRYLCEHTVDYTVDP